MRNAPTIAIGPGTRNRACLHHLFEAQVDRRPEAPAVVSGDTTLSYEQVERRANRLARTLRQRGVKAGHLVGLYTESSADAIVAILAVLKAGAAYLPLDPSHPRDRIRAIVAETSIVTLITNRSLGATAPDIVGLDVIEMDVLGTWWASATDRLSYEETGVCSSDLCCVMYTSGATGATSTPKGVMIEHRNAFSYVTAFNHVLGLTDADRVFQGFSLACDGSVAEMWMAFSNGGALVVPGRGAARFGNGLARLITDSKVTVLSTVPTSLANISDGLPTVRVLIVGGEPCPMDAVRRWATPGRRMLNVHGPSETTIAATVAECRPDRAVTMGRPLPAVRLHILDQAGRRVKPGETGELFIAGPGVARGYLKQPDLTRRHFVDLPAGFGDEDDSDSDSDDVDNSDDTVRAYRTGDLVSTNPGGELLFHGRLDSHLDSQMHARGFRSSDLSGIEAVLGEHASIWKAAVTTGERGGAGPLAAAPLRGRVGRAS